MMTSYK